MFPGKRMKAASRFRSARALGVLGIALLGALALTGCRVPQMMAEQPQYDPLEKSDFFPDGASSRPLVEGTVDRDSREPNELFDTGKENGEYSDKFPFPVTAEVMARGHERFDIYCSMCHGRLGDGDGMIPSRGLKRPPSFHTDRLRGMKNGYFFDVDSNGFGVMPAYRTMIPPEDRWAIVAYVRALQVSQNASIADVDPADRAKLESGAAPAAPAQHGGEITK